MKAFWWFEEGAMAGMARPGFNAVRWFDLPFEEAVLLGWIGRHSSGPLSLGSFRESLRTYVPRICKFHGVNEAGYMRLVEDFEDSDLISRALGRLAARTQILASHQVVGDQIEVEFDRRRLNLEMEFLKKQGVRRIVTLTEDRHAHDILSENFSVHHIGIEDLHPPTADQAVELAEILKTSRAHRETVAVHCLAGIGRTSTMLAAAHVLLGEDLKQLLLKLKRQNPSFTLTEAQESFLRGLSVITHP
jgi:hypothetical protein